MVESETRDGSQVHGSVTYTGQYICYSWFCNCYYLLVKAAYNKYCTGHIKSNDFLFSFHPVFIVHFKHEITFECVLFFPIIKVQFYLECFPV